MKDDEIKGSAGSFRVLRGKTLQRPR